MVLVCKSQSGFYLTFYVQDTFLGLSELLVDPREQNSFLLTVLYSTQL